MTEQSPRVLEFPSLRLDPIQITEHPGWGNDRIQARIGPYHVWMDATKTVHVADQRIANEEERLAQARTYTLTDAFTFGGGLILDDPETLLLGGADDRARSGCCYLGGSLPPD